MIRQFKKAISFLLIAGLGGAAGAYIYSSSSSTGFSISQKNNSSNAGVQYVNMPNAVDAALPDFTKAARSNAAQRALEHAGHAPRR